MTTALLEGAVQAWYDEISDYTFDTGACAAEMCGHYTQVVWADTTTMGCGTATCSATTAAGVSNGGLETTLLVCDYAPPGNIVKSGQINVQQPYIPGETCAACPDNCSNGLCTAATVACTNQDPSLTYNGVAYNGCAELLEAVPGGCSSWPDVGKTYCRLACGSCEVPAGE